MSEATGNSEVREKLITSHKNTLTNLENFVKMISQQLGSGLGVMASSLKSVIHNQGMELIILREMEQKIRNQSTASADEISALLEELIDLRQKIDAEAKEAIAKATAARAGNAG